MTLRPITLSCALPCLAILISSPALAKTTNTPSTDGPSHREVARQRTAGVHVSPRFRGLLRQTLRPSKRASARRPVTNYEGEIWVDVKRRSGVATVHVGKVPPRRTAKQWWGVKPGALDPFFISARKGKSKNFFDTTDSWQYMRFPTGRSLELHVKRASDPKKLKTQDGAATIRGRSGRVLWRGNASALMKLAHGHAAPKDQARLRRLTGFNPYHLLRALKETHLIYNYNEQKVTSELSTRYAPKRRAIANDAIKGLQISSRLRGMVNAVLSEQAKNVQYQNWWGKAGVIEAKTLKRRNGSNIQLFFGRDNKDHLWDLVAYRAPMGRYGPGQVLSGAALGLKGGKTLEVNSNGGKRRYLVRSAANDVLASGDISSLSKYHSGEGRAAQERQRFRQATGLSAKKMDRLLAEVF